MTGVIRVDTVKNNNGDGLPSMHDGTDSITVGTGWVRLASEEWGVSVKDEAIFDVVDQSKYINYMIYWYISHSTAWSVTSFRFRTSSGDYTTSQYGNSTYWQQATNGGSTATNHASYGGTQNFAWLAGNGTTYDSQGTALVSIPGYASGCASIRGSSQLLHRSAEGSHYVERFASSVPGGDLDPTTITGFKIYGAGYSTYGSIQVYGLVK
jgi:hypothetical protein